MTKYIQYLCVLLTAFVAAGCTLANVDPPPLAGPSEMSLSINMMANPDVLSLDGSSQTLVTVEARDANGQPAANVPLRVEILADGQLVDFGTISARTVVTNSNGRATFVYTAPPFVSGPIPDVQLSVTPTGTDASTHIRRVVSVRLVTPGSLGAAPTARFTFVPETPVAFADVRFDGSTSDAGLGAVITSYRWEFGDGSTGSGAQATHRYSAAGSYVVRLTVTNSNGLSNTTAGQVISVGAGAPPTADFLFSPEAPTTCDTVFFNGTISAAGEGHRITGYSWNWGDGSSSGSGSTRSHRFQTPGAWVVVLTVTDDSGQKDTANRTVTVDPGPSPCP
jgi:PKD repeat protein